MHRGDREHGSKKQIYLSSDRLRAPGGFVPRRDSPALGMRAQRVTWMTAAYFRSSFFSAFLSSSVVGIMITSKPSRIRFAA